MTPALSYLLKRADISKVHHTLKVANITWLHNFFRKLKLSCELVFKSMRFFCQNLKGFWYNFLSFWQSFLICSCKTVRKQVAFVGKLQVCHFLQQIIASRLKFYTTRFWIGPHNFEFLEKKSLSFWPKAKTLSYFGLEFFQKCTKNKPDLHVDQAFRLFDFSSTKSSIEEQYRGSNVYLLSTSSISTYKKH